MHDSDIVDAIVRAWRRTPEQPTHPTVTLIRFAIEVSDILKNAGIPADEPHKKEKD